MKEITVLSTRCLSKDQIEKLNSSGIKLIQHDFIAFEKTSLDNIKVLDLLLFTSKNAVEAVCSLKGYRDLLPIPVVCVGMKTKELLESYGWSVLAWADYASELAQIIEERFSDKGFTFFCGNLRRELLPQFFRDKNIASVEYEVYRTYLQPKHIEEKISGVMFYSPSGVESYLSENRVHDEVCFCIGTTTAEALRGITTRIVLAGQPTIDETISVCVSYYK